MNLPPAAKGTHPLKSMSNQPPPNSNDESPRRKPLPKGRAGRNDKHDRFTATALTLITLVVVLLAHPARAATTTFTVNSTLDTTDATPGDGFCDDGGGNCTLRAAIQEATATAGTDPVVIDFGISGAGVHTINPTLPPITRTAVTIDGTTQPGSSCGDLWGGTAPVWNIVVHGDGTAAGFDVSGGAATIRGLSMTGWTGGHSAIELHTAGGDAISCMSITGNSTGIRIDADSPNATIGGPAAGDGNVIAGNACDTLIVYNSTSTTVQGNFYGIGADGTTALGSSEGLDDQGDHSVIDHNLLSGVNGEALGLDGRYAVATRNYVGTDRSGNAAVTNTIGLGLTGFQNTVGGTGGAAARNIFSGNTDFGIGIVGVNKYQPAQNVVEGNYIGVGADGTTALANGYGVMLDASGVGTTSNNTFGGPAAGAGNVIANNMHAGITTFDSLYGGALGDIGTGNAFLGNSIYSNGGLGIDLAHAVGPEGVTANDAGDADTGPNDFQNFPVLTAAAISSGPTTVTGTINSTVATTFRLEFFASPAADPSGHGQGQTYLGTTSVTTDGSGNVSFTAAGLIATTAGYAVSATASKDEGGGNFSTSEFSTAVTVNAVPSITAGPSDNGSDATAKTTVGQNVTFSATATDADGDQYYLAVCKTNAATAHSNAAPTCDGGVWAISSATNSGSQASVAYTSLFADIGSDVWYAFVCDKTASSPACSASAQGAAVNGSPFVVVAAPLPPPPAPRGGGAGAPGWHIVVGPGSTSSPSSGSGVPTTGPQPPVVTPPSPAPPSPPALQSKSFHRDLALERAALVVFTRLFRHLPHTPQGWATIHVLAYGQTIAHRSLNAERQAIRFFVPRCHRLPKTSADWRAINVLAYPVR